VKGNTTQCITFDLWETLIFDEPQKDQARGRARYEGLHSALVDYGVNLALDDVKRAYDESAVTMQTVWNRNDEVPIIEQIQLITELAAGHSVNLEPSWSPTLEDAYVNPILSIPPNLNPEAPAILEAVRERGLKIGLISNTGRSPGSSLRQLLDNYGVLKFFDATVFSNEVKRRKPDRIIFDHASKLLGAKNEEVVHVGDNPEADYWGARNAGMQAILLDQTPPGSTQWPPNSLFALTRANMREGSSKIEPRWRIESLTQTLELMDSL